MSTEKVAALIADTQKELAHYLSELAAGRSFEMAGFDAVVQKIQAEIATLNPLDAIKFKDSITQLMTMLDSLQTGLQDKRTLVKSEIESINRQLTANKAYRNTDNS
jgi:septation ring formation regulator EzrA